jgi:hypothetical protein
MVTESRTTPGTAGATSLICCLTIAGPGQRCKILLGCRTGRYDDTAATGLYRPVRARNSSTASSTEDVITLHLGELKGL